MENFNSLQNKAGKIVLNRVHTIDHNDKTKPIGTELEKIIKDAFSQESLEIIKPSGPKDFFLNLINKDFKTQNQILQDYKEKYFLKNFMALETGQLLSKPLQGKTVSESFKKYKLKQGEKEFNSEEKLADKAFNRALTITDVDLKLIRLKEVLKISPMGGKTAVLTFRAIAEILCDQYSQKAKAA